jgi:cobalt-zinc-cadmium efflux system outer membrane protein
MDEAMGLFGQNSLALRIARAEALEIRGEARQTSGYFNPAFAVTGESLTRGPDRYWETTLALEQRLEWPGRTIARDRATAHLGDFADAAFRADSLHLAFEVRGAYADAWAAEEREIGLRETAAIIERVASAAQRRLEEGDISGYEARRLRLEQVRVDQDLAVAELEATAARRRLGTLIVPTSEGAEFGPADPLAGRPPPVDVGSGLETLTGRPDLQAATSALEAARGFASAASSGWVPDPVVMLGYKDQQDGFSGAAFEVALPLPIFDRRGGDAEAARARQSAASAALDLRRREARNDVLTASDRYASIRLRHERSGDGLVGDADLLLRAASAAYEEGDMTMLELLDAARAFRETRMTAASLRADVWIAYYDLLRALGRAPEENR